MNITKEIILPLIVLVLIVVAFATLATGVWTWQLSNECAGNGGTFTVEGTMAWCRY